MSNLHTPNQNHLIAALPTAEFERLSPQLELVPMRLGELLCESGDEMQHAYFPTTAIVSLHYVTEGGASAEVAGVGNEGMLGISLFMGGATTPSRAIVQTAGHGYQLRSRLLIKEFDRFGVVLRLLLRITVLDRSLLNAHVCECYEVVKNEFDRLLGDVKHRQGKPGER